jgi:hypothetical protein
MPRVADTQFESALPKSPEAQYYAMVQLPQPRNPKEGPFGEMNSAQVSDEAGGGGRDRPEGSRAEYI